MVDAKKRGFDETQPQEKGNRVKYAKAHSLRTQEAVARFGKSARHPLCLAALELWKHDAELSTCTKHVVRAEEVVNSAKQLKEKAQASIKQFHKEGKEKEANQASAHLRKIDEHLLKAQKCYQAAVKVRSFFQEWRPMAVARLEHKCDAVNRTRDVKARRALQRVRKRWIANEASGGDSDRRTVEMLEMLRDKVIKAAWAKGGAVAGYKEVALGGDRALSDEAWTGRLTAREIQSRLVDAPGDRHAKEVRRLAKKLGIILAEDQRGRKRKPHLPQQRQNVKRICPECLKYELEPRKRICRYCAIRPTFVRLSAAK
jgi:hypothetical protein